MKGIKKVLVTVAVAAMVFALTGCGLFGSDPAETVQEMLDAYTSGDVEEFKSYFEEDDRMHYLMKAVDGTGAGQMQEVYQKVYELTSKAEITVVGEVTEADQVTVRMKTVDYSGELYNAMTDAMKESGTKFVDAPQWMMNALNVSGEPVEAEVTVHVQPNGKMYGAEYNKDFFDVLTGGFYDYIGCTIASAVSGDNKSYMLGSFDQVLYSLDEYRETISGGGMTAGNVNGVITHFVAKYEGLSGVEAGGSYKETMVRLYLIVDYQNATSNSLQQIGILSGGNTDFISLEDSIKGMEASGYTCETTDFGVGVKMEKDK